MVAVVVAGALDAPRVSVTVRVTVYVPTPTYVWLGALPVPVLPSPKFQA